MKYLIPAIVLALACGGCASAKKPDTSAAAAASSPLDVGPTPAASVAASTYVPPQPVMLDPIPSAAPVAPVSVASASAGQGGAAYTVRKGDTLYKIARDRYGDGKQWQKIAMANPGVTPQGLKVGQTLVIP